MIYQLLKDQCNDWRFLFAYCLSILHTGKEGLTAVSLAFSLESDMHEGLTFSLAAATQEWFINYLCWVQDKWKSCVLDQALETHCQVCLMSDWEWMKWSRLQRGGYSHKPKIRLESCMYVAQHKSWRDFRANGFPELRLYSVNFVPCDLHTPSVENDWDIQSCT